MHSSYRRACIVGIGLSVVLILGILSMTVPHPWEFGFILYTLISISTIVLEIVMTIGLTVSSAVTTSRYVWKEGFTLPRLKRLSNWDFALKIIERIVDGWQNWLKFLAATSPVWVALILFPTGGQCYHDNICINSWQGNTLFDSLAVILWLIGLLLLLAFAAWLGVWFGTARQQPQIAARYAVLFM